MNEVRPELRPELKVLRNQRLPQSEPRITYPLWAVIAAAIMATSGLMLGLAALVML